MFPVSDDNPQVNKPLAVYALIALNALAWILLQGFGSGEALQSSVCQFGLIPADLFASALTANHGGACSSVMGLGWFGILSSMFMHGSWMHILGNMWFLWVFGDNIEDSMGSLRFILFYLLCGFLAAAAQIVSAPDSVLPMVGASGAIGGVMGAYIMLYPRVKVNLLVFFFIVRVPAFAMLLYWIAIQVIGGISSLGSTGGGTAFWAHVGGFVGGSLLIWLMKDDELLLKHPHHGWTKSENPEDVWDVPSNKQ
ncbi:MAG: rhomboid family intramembrane serine protease [Methylococcales bacterium]|nr:rhomboid family intramembrane serine protease [Methylococcales bacterium]